MAKRIIYKGKAAHAGGAPWRGRNAFYAATCGINAVNAIRETFKEADLIRVHPIMTHGGDMVNAIPAEVRMESYVRGSSFEGIVEANKRVNRALCGAALSLGCNVEIIDMPGYAPHVSSPDMVNLFVKAAELALPGVEIPVQWSFVTGSSDMGDLSCIMPIAQPHAGGVKGIGHGANYYVDDVDVACLQNAEWQITMLRLLLENGAERAKEILAGFKPMFPSKAEYFAFVDSLNDEGDRITYGEDNTASVRL
jgi:metal-dependent amidase/aminoacylase/carboxypeptidase family protein